MTQQTMLPLWEPATPDHTSRIVAHASNRVEWLRARSRGVTATDVARLSSLTALNLVAREKLLGGSFRGNAYTDHGKSREPEISRWVELRFGIPASDALFHAVDEPLHMATPDGIGRSNGVLVLAEIKTTTKEWRSIPRSYLRQIWWQQYVLGAERTLVVWEQHDGFVPVNEEPECRWIERDENEIHVLVGLANRLLRILNPDAQPTR